MTPSKLRCLRTLAGCAAWLLLAWANPGQAAPAVSIDGVWCGLSDMSPLTAFVYLTISVKGEPSDRLIGAHTPIADKADILAPQPLHGRFRLEPVTSVDLENHAPNVFEPYQTHIILRKLHHRLAPGDSFPITLEFEHAGKRDVTAKVLKHPPGTGMPPVPKDLKLD